MPKRRSTEQYWSEQQFMKLTTAPPARLRSAGPLPWRLLAYMLGASPEVEIVRRLVSKRLLDPKRLQRAQDTLDQMLLTLWRAGYVTLEPEPKEADTSDSATENGDQTRTEAESKTPLLEGVATPATDTARKPPPEGDGPAAYRAQLAHPTPELSKLLILRGVNPIYGVFMVNQLGIADRAERIQALESVLDMPGTVARYVRVPRHDELPPGPLATMRLDEQLLRLGLVSAEQLREPDEDEKDRRRGLFEEERVWVLTLAEKLRILFDYDFPGVHDVRTTAVWSAGELIEFGGDFNKYITSKGLQKQEGVVFRHLLRLILLTIELSRLYPPDTTEEEWRGDMTEIADQLTTSCRQVDPDSTEHVLEQAQTEAESDM